MSRQKNASGGLIGLTWWFLHGLNVTEKKILECDTIPRKTPRSRKTKTNNGASLKVQRIDRITQKWPAAAHFSHLAWCHFLVTPDQAEIWCPLSFQKDSELTEKEKKGRKPNGVFGGLWKAEPERVTFRLKTYSFWDHGLLSRSKYPSHCLGQCAANWDLMAMVPVLFSPLLATEFGLGCCLLFYVSAVW